MHEPGFLAHNQYALGTVPPLLIRSGRQESSSNSMTLSVAISPGPTPTPPSDRGRPLNGAPRVCALGTPIALFDGKRLRLDNADFGRVSPKHTAPPRIHRRLLGCTLGGACLNGYCFCSLRRSLAPPSSLAQALPCVVASGSSRIHPSRLECGVGGAGGASPILSPPASPSPKRFQAYPRNGRSAIGRRSGPASTATEDLSSPERSGSRSWRRAQDVACAAQEMGYMADVLSQMMQ